MSTVSTTATPIQPPPAAANWVASLCVIACGMAVGDAARAAALWAGTVLSILGNLRADLSTAMTNPVLPGNFGRRPSEVLRC